MEKRRIRVGEVKGIYRFAFNGQEKDDELKGRGNHNTAEFWQYDTRLGRRWNIDPKPTVGISSYATFANNPIMYTDIKGDTINGLNEINNNNNTKETKILNLSETWKKTVEKMGLSKVNFNFNKKEKENPTDMGATGIFVNGVQLNEITDLSAIDPKKITVNVDINVNGTAAAVTLNHEVSAHALELGELALNFIEGKISAADFKKQYDAKAAEGSGVAGLNSAAHLSLNDPTSLFSTINNEVITEGAKRDKLGRFQHNTKMNTKNMSTTVISLQDIDYVKKEAYATPINNYIYELNLHNKGYSTTPLLYPLILSTPNRMVK